MRTSFEKIAISVPQATLRGLERARLRTKKSRSALVTLAIDEFLNAGGLQDADKEYRQGYERAPESGDEDAVVAHAVKGWGEWAP